MRNVLSFTRNAGTSCLLVVVLSLVSPLSVLAQEVVPPPEDTATTSTTTQTPPATETQTTTAPPADTATAQTQPVTTTTETPPAATSTDTTASTQPATTTSDTTTRGATQTGPAQPNGDAAKTYTYNESTGLWENDYYTWDPVSKQTVPKGTQTFSYNPATGKWDTTDWEYNAATGKYEPNTRSVAIDASELPALMASNPGAKFVGFFDATISNNNTTTAITGNALLSGNTFGGNASSGNALAMATIMNLLASSASFSGGNLATFMSNIQGDVVGDLLINPSQLSNLPVTTSNPLTDGLKVTNQSSGQINNNIAVNAISGNAVVESNTQAGDATTGNADAIANVVNLLNSAIAAGSSFMGAINIYGNLDGDILLPPGFLDSLLAANTPVANLAPTVSNPEVLAEFTNNQSITNNLATNATTGNATLANNTSAGSATTGDALSNITVLNLTGSDVIGANNLLVFVNVLGKWVGLIMDAPTGTTAASLGGSITRNAVLPASIESTSTNEINNNILANASTGDATVANNTRAGDATTGDATASINLVNFINSKLALSDWFGILFINVFGTWNGSFGIDTAAGTIPIAPASGRGGGSNDEVKVFRFVDNTADNSGGSPKFSLSRVTPASYTGGSQGSGSDTEGAVLASATRPASSIKTPAPSATTANEARQSSASLPYWLFSLGIAAILLGIDRYLSIRRGPNYR